ncbi:MAG: zinc ribbon domain-containing protein [Pseudomonadota bacterium]|nr:zinc ribbon domain-containing protein [Pseudomonadota bacterium]
MPIYEYECADCGKISEFLQGMTGDEPEARRCRFCGGDELRRLMSPSVLPRSRTLSASPAGGTCCGREQRCDTPPCADGGGCRR